MLRLLAYQWRLHPYGVRTALADAVFSAAVAVGTPWLVGSLVADLPAVLTGGGVGKVAVEFGCLVGVIVGAIVLAGMADLLYSELSLRTERDVMLRLTRLCLSGSRIDHLETPEFLDRIARVRERVWRIDQGFLAGARAVSGIAILAGAAISVGVVVSWWLAVLLAGLSIADSVLDAVLAKRDQSVWSETTEPQRRADYVFSTKSGPAAKEIRIFGLSGFLTQRFYDEMTAALRPIWRRRRMALGWQLAMVTVRCAAAVAAIVWVVDRAVAGELTTAAAAVAIPLVLELAGAQVFGAEAAAQGAQVLADLVDTERQFPVLTVDGPAEAEPNGPDTLPAGITLKDVTFHYPGREEAVLERLSLTIEPGSTVGVVGVNGAGKSTLIKLICGALVPDSGTVVVDGKLLGEGISARNWQTQVAVVTQDIAHYPLSARDNVLAAIGRLDGTEDDDDELAAIAETAAAADVIGALPGCWTTVLSGEFTDGQELSGGQWQRLALARIALAVRHGARAVILDEPAAALDSRAEDFLIRRQQTLTGQLTTIVVSHRFSVLRPLQRIVVLDGGRIIEDGDHASLMAVGGEYSRLFTLQAQRLIGTAS